MRPLRWFWRVLEKNFIPLIFLGVWVLVMLFINYGRLVAQNAKDAKDTAAATQQIVKTQDETLQAIKDLATDNKLTSKQLGDTIICMLQVPIDQRTTEVQDKCRRQAENPTPPSSAQNTSQNSTSNTSQNTNSTSTNTPNQQPTGGGGGTSPSLTQQVMNILEAPGRFLGGLLGQ